MLQVRPRQSVQNHIINEVSKPKISIPINPLNFVSTPSRFNHHNCNNEKINQILDVPIFKGHFINFHHESIVQDETYTLSGVEDGFAYFVLQNNVIRFHFFSPIIEDLNFYYNTDQRKYKFPTRIKEQKLRHIEQITAVGFQLIDDIWTMAIASEFYIYFYTFSGDLDNFEMQKEGINNQGEVINQILFYRGSLIFGGSSGDLSCCKSNTLNLKDRIKKQINRIFKEFNPFASEIGLSQLILNEELQICIGLFEKYDKNQNIEDTYIRIYQLENFKEICIIKQSQLYQQNIDIKNSVDIGCIQFYHSYIIKKNDGKIQIIITTISQIQLNLTLEQNINGYSYHINNIKYPQVHIEQNIPYGVCLDESRIQYKQKEMLSIQGQQDLKGVYREKLLSLFHVDNYLIAQFIDMAHQQFQRTLEQNIPKYQSIQQLQQSIYRDTSMEAIEQIDLHGQGQFPRNMYSINRITIKRLFDHCDINESQLYNLPEHYVCIADNTIEHIVRLRPIDCFFTAIKVTHSDFIEQIDTEFPLEKLIRAFGIEESCSQILQIIIQDENLFYINVELQHQYQLDLQKAYQRIHHSEYISKFFEDDEKIPQWVTGQVYVRKGSIIKEKALKAFYFLVKRSFNEQILYNTIQQKSKKVISTGQLIWKIVAPLTTKNLLNEQVYNLECNKSIENYSINQLKIVYNQIEKLIQLFDKDCYFFANKNSKNDTQEENNQNFNYKNGFSKYVYETFEQNSRLESSRSTTDCSLAININVDVEHSQMKLLHELCLKIKQLIGFLIYFFGELQGVRNIINSYLNKSQLFNLTIKTVLDNDQYGIIVLKQLMIHIIKNNKSKFKDTAQYMNNNFPQYFTIQDFKICLAQNSFDEILQFSAQQNLIKLNPNEQIHEKIKRILKLSKAPQITIEKVLEKREIFLYYKELQPQIQEQLMESLKSMEEVICAISYQFLCQSFQNYMYPFATFKYFISFLVTKCKQYEKDDTNEEFRNSALMLMQQFDMLIALYFKPGKLTQLQVKEIIIESLQILNKIKFNQTTQITQVIANRLYNVGLNEFFQYIDFLIDLDIQQCSELEKLQLQEQQLSKKAFEGDAETIYESIQLLLKLAQISLLQHPELSFEEIQNKLSIKQRLKYTMKAQEFIRKYQNLSQLKDTNELLQLAQDLSRQLFLQDIMYDYVINNENDSQNYITEKRKILIEIHSEKTLLTFFQDNKIYFAEILCMDFIENKGIQIFDTNNIDKKWCNFFINDQDNWPSNVLKHQFHLILENLINKDKYLRLKIMIQAIELRNSMECCKIQETLTSNWFFNEVLLLEQVTEFMLLSIYIDNYKISNEIQNTQMYQELQNDTLYAYKFQIIQQVLVLIEVCKRNNTPQQELQLLILQIKNQYFDEMEDLKQCDQLDQNIVQEIRKQLEKL